MRTVLLLACALAFGCKKKIEQKRTEKLDFKSFTIAVPGGWNEVTDKGLEKPTGTYALVPVEQPPGFAPSIFLQEVELEEAGHELLRTATVDVCTTEIQAAIVRTQPVNPGPVKLAAFGDYKGCDLELLSRDSAQAARHISISNGKIALSLVCNRDKAGAPTVDATCVTIANAITPK